MIFNTPWFLIFLIVSYPIFLLLPNSQFRFYFILLISAVFHTHFAGPAGVVPIIIMGVATFFIARRLGREPRGNSGGLLRRRGLLVLGLLIPVLGLIYYKYRYFIFTTLSFLPDQWLQPMAVFFQPGPLPLAISFFTFEFVHYLTDVARGEKPTDNFLQFSMFSIFFPSIVSGPIKRFQHFVPQIRSGLTRPAGDDILLGLGQVALGFGKKLIIADNASLMANLLEKQAQWNFYSVSLLIILLSIRILFDFSGYSDIAIGLARMLGIRLPINFNFPYIARNLSEFWNRWHISLSSWIRDYLYIPLGGGRVPIWRKAFNLTLVMALCGLWHGAAWNFMLWGIYQGLGLGAHAWYENRVKRGVISFRLPAMFAWGATLIFVCYGWLWFFYPWKQVLHLTRCLLIF